MFQLALNNAQVRQLTLTDPVKVPTMPAHTLRNEIVTSVGTVQRLVNGLRNIVFKSKPSTLSGRLITDNLKIHNANMDSVVITTLNGKNFNPNNLLMHNRHQKLTGMVSANLLASDVLTVGSLNSVDTQGIL